LGLPRWIDDAVILILTVVFFLVSLAALIADYGTPAFQDIAKFILGGIGGAMVSRFRPR